ncbi:MAG TPA: DUF3817 domain-containing protein [Acidimicrobiales bacterium]|nr:DUF3817 domain-containing protein [Acidimicrobiales bacterium]
MTPDGPGPRGMGGDPAGGAWYAPMQGTEGSLLRYRVLALAVGTGLAVLCFVGVPLQLIGHFKLFGHNSIPWDIVVEIVGPVHGILYIIYLLSCLDLAARARFRTFQLVGMLCSGLLPGLAFYMEHKVTERVREQLALGPAAPPGPAASFWAVITRRPGTFAARLPVEEHADGGHREQVGHRGQVGSDAAAEVDS